MSDNDSASQVERHLAVFSHLLCWLPLPIINLLVPWLLLKTNQQSAFIRRHFYAAANFQLTLFIAYIIATALLFTVAGFLMIMGLALLNIVFVSFAAYKAYKGVYFHYPFAINFIQKT